MAKKTIKKAADKKKEASKEGLQAPKGMHDVLPSEWPWRNRISAVVDELADFYNFSMIETPILERAELFERGVGVDTDLVGKEMYFVKSKGEDMLVLRPEGTAPIARAYLEHHMGRSSALQKLYYKGPMFRHERPQAGRFRQFNQAGFEIIGGGNDPIYDAEIILIFQRLLEKLKIKNIVLKINSIGCRVCRPVYKKQLQAYYKDKEKKLCSDCQRRLKTNPLRLLDCKNETCIPFKAEAPNFFDKLCSACTANLKGVFEYLDELKIPYTVDNTLVRGLDYYSRTVFEFSVEGPGQEVGALPGGGRYDYLMEMLGGRMTPAIGGAVGIERLIAVMKAQEAETPRRVPKKVFVIHVGELAKKKSLNILERLRSSGISVGEALGRDSLKAQLRLADREGVRLALIFGQKEIFENSIIIRDLETHLQESVPMDTIVEEVKKRLAKKKQ
ncbi:MAG TPA: histidine--tRNA ligase [Candidatus Paceibacterota bacterium]|nr:histidine--tRNA ligase [Candidatus Paceibacterota bacterium]